MNLIFTLEDSTYEERKVPCDTLFLYQLYEVPTIVIVPSLLSFQNLVIIK